MWFRRTYFVPYQPISYFVPEDLKLNQPQTGTTIFLVSILLRFTIPAVLMYFLCKKKCHWKSSLSICPCSSKGYIHQVDHGSARVCAEAISLQVFVWTEKKKKTVKSGIEENWCDLYKYSIFKWRRNSRRVTTLFRIVLSSWIEISMSLKGIRTK